MVVLFVGRVLPNSGEELPVVGGQHMVLSSQLVQCLCRLLLRVVVGAHELINNALPGIIASGFTLGGKA